MAELEELMGPATEGGSPSGVPPKLGKTKYIQLDCKVAQCIFTYGGQKSL